MTDLIVILAFMTVVGLLAFTGILFIGLEETFLSHISMALVDFASGSHIGSAKEVKSLAQALVAKKRVRRVRVMAMAP